MDGHALHRTRTGGQIVSSFNKVVMLGNMVRDPGLSYLTNQTPVVEFQLATNRKFKDSKGEDREETCFIDCRLYGKRAEIILKYCKKSSPLLIEGRLQLDRWEAPDGSKRSKHRILVEDFTFVSKSQEDSDESASQRSWDRSNDIDDIPF